MKYQVSSDPITHLKPVRHQDGWVSFDITATGTGILSYADSSKSDGIRRELRHPSDIFHGDSLDSLAGIPVTDLHPTVGRVTQDNRITLQKGTVHTKINTRFSADSKKTKTTEDLLKSKTGLIDVLVTVHDKDLIARIDSAESVNVSMGYDCAMLPVAGTWHGQRFDAIQKNIIYNHSAILPDVAGRHPSAKAHVDSVGADGILDVVSFFDNGKPATFGDSQILKVDQSAIELLSHYDSLIVDDQDLKSEIDILKSDSITVPVSYFFIDRANLEATTHTDTPIETMPTENTMKISFGDAELQVSADQYAVLNAVKSNYDAQIAALTEKVDTAEGRADEAETETEKLQGRYDGLEYDKNQLDVELSALKEAKVDEAEQSTETVEMIPKSDAQDIAVTLAEEALELCAKADSLGFTLAPKNAIHHAAKSLEQITSVYRDRLISTGRFDAKDLDGQPLETLQLIAKGAVAKTQTDSTDLSIVSNLAGSNPTAEIPASFSEDATKKLRAAGSNSFGSGFVTLADLQGRKA
jgi:hypothetical protein